jgi:hypothetical protein
LPKFFHHPSPSVPVHCLILHLLLLVLSEQLGFLGPSLIRLGEEVTCQEKYYKITNAKLGPGLGKGP